MTDSAPVPADHPLMIAWNAYKASEAYANTLRWAKEPAHTEGSLWAAFSEGFAALSRPQPVAETVEAREFIDNWFAPWGSWKTAWWEMAVSDDVEMTDANALKALRKILAALRPSAHGEAG